jgi:chloride channel, nucleotide-sensitive, 1A
MTFYSIITSVPEGITPAEHDILTQTTPSSFTSIPPVVHFKGTNAFIKADPPEDLWEEGHGDIYVTSQ